MAKASDRDGEDDADRHVARWRDHWIDVDFDDEVEGAVVRMQHLVRHFREAKQRAVAQVGLQAFEYDTLHTLMIRDTPGHASPTDLATDLGVSPAGMTGRLDTLEKAGYVGRTVGKTDRRRVEVEITDAGADIWRQAMAIRGDAEDQVVNVLSKKEQIALNQLLKRMTLSVEAEGEQDH
ncbi:MarR family winged helix-turn-helix transcriptional regulator [Nocardioides speluncae]|uniref:MarR family winged helix-turn-helix transcriptional regulator n=1 Tax=Nocardioides speluncae TaxID=2670337 RepID=UPI000D6865C7|nr:MarR family transcriptional regulator [Nocardioides speluncae]